MKALLSVLVALNIVFASVGIPVFVGGVGLGSGGAGSSFKQPMNLAQRKSLTVNDQDLTTQLEAAKLIFENACDKDNWKGQPVKYPETTEEISRIALRSTQAEQNLLSKMETTTDDNPCQPYKEGQSHLVFVGGNGLEMAHMFKGFWDKRVLVTIAYVMEKRLNVKNPFSQSTKSVGQKNLLDASVAEAATPAQNDTSGYQEKCDWGDKTAPSMTLGVTAGYMDSNGQPTAMARSGEGDDPSIKNDTNASRPVSPAGRGQQVKFYSIGCTVIKKGKEIQQVVANSVALGQDTKTGSSAPGGGLVDKLLGQTGFSDKGLMGTALSATFTKASSFFMAGVYDAQSKGLGAVLTAAGISDPSAFPKIIPTPGKDKTNLSYEDKASEIAGKVVEQKYSMPSGSLKLGANLEQIGLSALFDQTGIKLTLTSSPDEITQATKMLAQFKNPEASVQVPAETVSFLQRGQFEQAAKYLGAFRLNNQFSLNWTKTDLNNKSVSGIDGTELGNILKGYIPVADSQDSQMIEAVSSGGYEQLKKQLSAIEESGIQTPSGKLASILQNAPQLDPNQITALNDFQESKYRDSRADKMQSVGGPKELVDWLKENKGISGEDEESANAIIKEYSKNSNGKLTLQNDQGKIYDRIILASVSLMRPDEQAIFWATVGANPTATDLRQAFSDGTIEKAGEAVLYSRGLQNLGVPASESNYMAVAMASGKMDGTSVGLTVLNSKFASYGVTFTKQDLALAQDGRFPALQKLAIGFVSQKTGINISAVISAFSGDKSQKEKINSALSDYSNSKNVIDAALNKSSDNGITLGEAAAKQGAYAKATAIAAGISEGENAAKERAAATETLSQAFDDSIDAKASSKQNEAENLLVNKGLSANDANKIVAGNAQSAAEKAAVGFVSKKLAAQGLGDQATIAKVISGKATAEEKYAMGDALAKNYLSNNGIYVEGSISQTLFKGTSEQRLELAREIGGQYATNEILNRIEQTTGVSVSLTTEQRQQFAKGDFSALGDVANQTAQATAADGLSDATGGVIPAETITKAYTDLKEDGAMEPGAAEDIGWGVVEENFGINKEVITNFDSNFKNLPNNIVQSFNMEAINTQLTGIGAGIIVGTILGNTLAKIDPTGGILTSFAMQYATSFIMSLGISMPILLGVAFLINPAATLQAIKGMIMMALGIFTDPLGTIMGFFGFGSKKPKATSSAQNPSNANKDTIKEPSGFVDTPQDNPSSGNIALAADAKDNIKEVRATSDYLPAKKPSKSYLQKISRRTTDQTVEDLLLLGLVCAANRKLQAVQTDFVQNHWSQYMGSFTPTISFSIKQLISPRAPVAKNKQEAAKNKGEDDFMYEKEPTSGAVGIDFTLDLTRLVFGNNFSPLNSLGRKTGFNISSAVNQYIGVSF